jgi:2-iminobutanoate/2-iminopropanoate deaminase
VTHQHRVYTSARAPKPVGPYSQAVSAGGFLFTAGQVGLSPATGKLVGEGVAEQTRQALENLRAVLEEAGLSFRNVVRTTIFLTSMDDFAAVNAVYAELFDGPPPARSTVAVRGLPLGGKVEIDMVAHTG